MSRVTYVVSLALFTLASVAAAAYTNVTIECLNMVAQFGEIEIFLTNGTNIARQGTASMSSVAAAAFGPSYCIDGNLESKCTTQGTAQSMYQWIQVTVPAPATSIANVKLWQVWNREFWQGCWLTLTDSVQGVMQQRNLQPSLQPSYITNTCPWNLTMNYNATTTVQISSCPRSLSFSKLSVYDKNGTDVALNGYATMSSTLSDYQHIAIICLDGRDVHTPTREITCQQNYGDKAAWWKAVIPSDYRQLTYLKIQPRVDDGSFHPSGCLLTVTATINDWKVDLMNFRIPGAPNGDLKAPYTFNITKPTSSVSVQCSNTYPLTLTEVEVFTANGINIALQGTAASSSQGSNVLPATINDGDNTLPFSTNATDTNPWIQVSLPLPASLISKVKVWNAANVSIGNGCSVTVADSINGIVQQRNLQQFSSATPTSYNLDINYGNSTTVFDSTGNNVALNSYATASSPYIAKVDDTDSFPAFNCLDGKDLCGNQLFCLTGKDDASPWWKTVITNDVNSLTSVKIYPRDGDATLAGCSLLVQGSQYNVAKLNVTLPVIALGDPYIFNF